MTPTQRTLAELKRRGWTAQVVERWNSYARVRVDLFGCIDIVAICPGVKFFCEECNTEHFRGDARPYNVGIQCTSGSGHSARRAKILEEPRIREWIEAGAKMLIWSWSKKGAKGKRKIWTLREEEIAL